MKKIVNWVCDLAATVFVCFVGLKLISFAFGVDFILLLAAICAVGLFQTALKINIEIYPEK